MVEKKTKRSTPPISRDGLEQVQRPAEIRVRGHRRMAVEQAGVHDPARVDDAFGPVGEHDLEDPWPVVDRPLLDGHPLDRVAEQEPGLRPELRQVEAHDGVPAAEQLADHVAAGEPRPAGDQDGPAVVRQICRRHGPTIVLSYG